MSTKTIKKSFKEKYPLETRKIDAQRRINENPGHLPIVVTLDKNNKIPNAENFNGNYLICSDYTLAEFQHVIRQRMKLSKEVALMFFVNKKKLLKLDSIIEEIYKQYKEEDEILYITMTDIAAYGN